MTVDKTGYYVNLVLNLALLTTGVFAVFTIHLTDQHIGSMFALVLLNCVHLLLVYPVYHIDDFEYVPAEDPEASPNKEFHLIRHPLTPGFSQPTPREIHGFPRPQKRGEKMLKKAFI